MKFLELICIERETTDEENAVMRNEIGGWVEDTINRRVNITGKPLDAPETAKTVHVRDGETLISDGPYVDTKEFIGGLDLLDCESIEQAIEVAAKHPVSWFNAIELRPFPNGDEIPPSIDPATMQQLMFVCVDGVPEAPAVEAQIESDCSAWREQIEATGVHLLGQRLAGPAAAKTVRVRNGETLVSDGPFVETKEFIGGLDILNCARFDEAVDWAAKHPIARFHKIEVRRFRNMRNMDAGA